MKKDDNWYKERIKERRERNKDNYEHFEIEDGKMYKLDPHTWERGKEITDKKKLQIANFWMALAGLNEEENNE